VLGSACSKAADTARADQTVKDYYAWTQALTEHGVAVANATFDTIDGKAEKKAVETARSKALRFCEDGVARFDTAGAKVRLSAFQAWHATAMGYARWECAQVTAICDEMLARIDNPVGTADARKRAIVEWITVRNQDELARKAEIEAATAALYTAMNGSPQ
jgi:hypothetical protein